MRMRVGVLSVVILFLVVFAMGCSKADAPKPAGTPVVSAAAEGKALFEQKCGVCHDIGRATARQETKEKWTEIVKTMQGKKADWIADADVAKIVEFLASEHGKK
jgi:mono/diheme cytochrome c family protein